MAATNLVEVRGLKKYFKTPKGMLHAVDNVNFGIERGTTLGVVGESGCGKSTLGRVILQLLKATDGEVLFDGEDIAKYTTRQMRQMRHRMQLIFQDPYASLDPRQSVSEAIGEPLKVSKACKSQAEYAERVSELMQTVGLADRYANSYPHELDGGRRQRIGIARALALNPDFIVCDEPVSALDVSIQAQILNLLMDLQEAKGLTYMFITHDLSVVKHISDKIAVLYLGQMVEYCESNELFRAPMHPYTQGLLKCLPRLDSDGSKPLEPIEGTPVDLLALPAGCPFAPRCEKCRKVCLHYQPPYYEINPGHTSACWLHAPEFGEVRA